MRERNQCSLVQNEVKHDLKCILIIDVRWLLVEYQNKVIPYKISFNQCGSIHNEIQIQQLFNSLMRRNISTFSNLKQNSNTNNVNRSKSPKRIVNGVRLYNFSQIQSYRYINRPYLNEVKKEHIKDKLNLQKTTEARVAKRTKKNQMFIPFNYNPFSYQRLSKSLANIVAQDKDLAKQEKDAPIIDSKNNTSKNNTSKNIIEQIDNLKKKKLDKETESKQFSGVQLRAKEFSVLVQKQAKNRKAPQFYKQKKEMNKSMIALRAPEPKVSDEQEIIKLEGQMQFEDIIQLKEDRFQQRKGKPMNIFKLLHDKEFLNKKTTTLDKFFFSFNSIFDKFQKYKIPFYRDMSRQSRTNVSKKPQGKTDFFETMNHNDIQFNDLVNVASGRFTPQMVYSLINFEKANDNSNYSEAVQDQVSYNGNTENRGTAAIKNDQSAKEVDQFLKLALNKKEQDYLRLNIFRKQAMRKQLEQVQKLINISIYDKKIHKQLREQVNRDLGIFVNEHYRYPKVGPQRDALIRANKEQKGKNQIIKLKKLVQSFQIVKQHDSKVNQLINKRI